MEIKRPAWLPVDLLLRQLSIVHLVLHSLSRYDGQLRIAAPSQALLLRLISRSPSARTLALVLTRNVDLDRASVRDLLEQPQQIDLIFAETDMNVVGPDGVDADTPPGQDREQEALAQVRVPCEAEEVALGFGF